MLWSFWDGTTKLLAVFGDLKFMGCKDSKLLCVQGKRGCVRSEFTRTPSIKVNEDRRSVPPYLSTKS